MAKPSRTISFLYPDCIVSVIVSGVRGSIITIRKHIVSQKTLAGGGVGVCVDESAQGGGVISALEVIEPGFLTIVLSQHCFRCLLSIVEEATKGVQKADFPSYRLSLSPFIIRQLKAFLQQ